MNWQPYIRASWEIVMECESRSQLFLDEELEAYLVQMMARNFRNKDMPPDIVCLELAQARDATDFRNIGDSCFYCRPTLNNRQNLCSIKRRCSSSQLRNFLIGHERLLLNHCQNNTSSTRKMRAAARNCYFYTTSDNLSHRGSDGDFHPVAADVSKRNRGI